jgi:hypothetical protein
MADLQVGDLVRDIYKGKTYRIRRFVSVYGIPTADMIYIRKDGSEGIMRNLKYKNLPLTHLEKVEGKPLVEVL